VAPIRLLWMVLRAIMNRNWCDMNWARTGNDDAEYSAFVAENASGGGRLLAGTS
jgi:hypothetical protein